MIITFCGHANYTETNEDKKIILKLFEDLSKNEDLIFYVGGYGNFDWFATRCALEYKEKHSNAKIIFITPYLNKWLDERKSSFNKYFDEIIYPSLENVPQRYAISRRNEWMINKADFVLAYVKFNYGGAYKSLQYAINRNKYYYNLYNVNF